jgi:hypothetical protein
MDRRTWTGWRTTAALLAAFLAAGCTGADGDDGKAGKQGPPGVPGPAGPPGDPAPTDTDLPEDADLPGLVLAITGLSGGTGPAGQFRVGDTLSFTYTLAKGDGSPIAAGELDRGSVFVSGPSSNYQRVIPSASDLATASVRNLDGSYTYTFATPFPAVYAAPLNDTASFGPSDGELAGQALLDGTYTLGIELYKEYAVGDATFRDSFNHTEDFLFGAATVLQPREVVTRANCNLCHENLQAHGTFRRDVKLCVLCHTSGAEDGNVASAAGGTPGVSIDFRVMIHRIHDAKHLPSVLGVGTAADGSRDYARTQAPYVVQGRQGSLHDFSDVGFPVWPNLNVGMPRDAGYSLLPAGARAQEDEMLRGVTACAKCHGDPDGAGPAPAPAQGGNAYSVQSRKACGSCHDDVDWTRPYVANGVSMPAQSNDANCLTCHPASGSTLSPADAHVHPLNDPAFNPGVVFSVASVAEAPGGNGDGNLDPGEKPLVAFTVKDLAGADVPVNTLNSMTAVVSGPTTNSQLLLVSGVPVAYYGAGPGYSVTLPEIVNLEYLGLSTAGTDSAFATARAPHWNLTGGATAVSTVSTPAGGGLSALSSAAPACQNFLDVGSAANFARNDYLVVDEGTPSEEYLRIQTVEGTRLWFNSIGALGTYQPSLRFAHAAGAAVKEVALTARTAGTHYTLVASTGQVTEVADAFGGNRVVATYTTDYVLPAKHPAPYNDTPSMDESWGEWTGKALADGTYTVTLYGSVTRVFSQAGENTSYNGAAPGASRTFLVGTATAETPYAAISSGNNCLRCHDDLYFHGGGRRGFDACISCHGTSGFEDRPRYVAPNAPETAATPVSYRTMLHKIHRGKELPDAATYAVVGFGSGAYPNNYGVSMYDHVGFPAMPDGAKDCAVCHGAGTTNWQSPPERNHPAGQALATRSWRATCGACHASSAALAHMDVNTSPSTGAEACAVCHGIGKEWPVELKHKVR